MASSCSNTVVVIHNAEIRIVDDWIENENVTAVIFAHFSGQDSVCALVDIPTVVSIHLVDSLKPWPKLQRTTGFCWLRPCLMTSTVCSRKLTSLREYSSIISHLMRRVLSRGSPLDLVFLIRPSSTPVCACERRDKVPRGIFPPRTSCSEEILICGMGLLPSPPR